jgi:hypothetical protein
MVAQVETSRTMTKADGVFTSFPKEISWNTPKLDSQLD